MSLTAYDVLWRSALRATLLCDLRRVSPTLVLASTHGQKHPLGLGTVQCTRPVLGGSSIRIRFACWPARPILEGSVIPVGQGAY